MKTEKCYDIRVQKSEADIDIFGVIGDVGIFEEGPTAASFISELRSLGRLSRLNINIHSVGGSFWDGMAMYRAIRDLQMAPKGVKVAHVPALAASAATLPMLAADRIEVAPEAGIMIHRPLVGIFGNEEDFEEAIARLKSAKQQLLQVYQRRTGDKIENLTELLNAETWFIGEEAVAAGFADVVKEDVPKARIAALATDLLAKYKNTPAKLLNRGPAPVAPEVAARLKKLGVVG